jgi:hypothetical protein
MKITKSQLQQIIKEELEKIRIGNTETVTEDTFHDEERHDDENENHLEKIRREINFHIDMLKKQHDRAEGRHEEREDD